MESCRRGESKHMHFLSNVNSKKKLNIVEKKSILEKVHILPIKRKVENADPLYRELQLMINDKCVLYEGFIIAANGEKEKVPGGGNTRKGMKEDLTNDKAEGATKSENHITGTNLLEKLSSDKEGTCPNGDPWEVAHRKESNSYAEKQNSSEKDRKNTPSNDHICLHEKRNKDKLADETSHFKENTDYYVVVNCIPSKGILTRDTLIYTDGKYVDNLKKIHLIIIRDKYYKKYEKKLKKKFFSLKKYILKKGNQFFNEAMSLIPFSFDHFSSKCSSERGKNNSTFGVKHGDTVTPRSSTMRRRSLVLEKILLTCLHPYFKKNRTKLFYSGKLLLINNFSFLVVKIDADVNVGFVDNSTEICLNADAYDPFRNVHIVPLYDTLPTTYNYNIFADYIKPYIERHYLSLFSMHDTFFYKGVQFKIMGIDPMNIKSGRGRITCNTFIYTEGAIKPTFFDVISNESINYIQCLPVEYKPYAVLNILQQLDADSLLRLFPSTNANLQESALNEQRILSHLDKYKYVYKNHTLEEGQGGKMLLDVDAGEHIDAEKHIDAANKSDNFAYEQCAVCFEHFQDYDKCIKLACLHTYHWKCVKSWFRFNLTCPCCRRELTI
ncbi:RING zinc finger protein, putative [Plasmodium vivax]|uniref:RING-type E3 ubiquitin transferase n=1 Tax=Plasmodium vivax TaxID=5855 RepID=A0A564ZT76_PLAVI|nr:RING zinc finger protein, putative [Plasmodium vivax]VUZ95199.1 RING zinc finger protein, putative [Plasmodium vivax]